METYTTYTLSIGLNDKDTHLQEVNTLDAYKVVCNLINRGCTITEGTGFYTHEDGTQVIEKSLIAQIIDFDGTLELKEVEQICDKIKLALNQESVVIVKGTTTSTLY